MNFHKILYCMIWAISLLFFFLYRGLLSLELLIVCTIFPLLLFLLLLWQKKSLSVSCTAAVSQASCNEKFYLQLRMRDRCPIPVHYAIVHLQYTHSIAGDTENLSIHVPVLGGNTQIVRLPLSSFCCGMITVRITDIRIYDPLSLFMLRLRCSDAASVLVMPAHDMLTQLPDLPQPLPTEYSDRYSAVRAGDDPSEVFSVEPYQFGDHCSQIHWKLTAKTNDLMVKHFSLPLQEDIVLFPDYRRCGNARRDAVMLHGVISAFYSLSLLLHENDTPHSAVWHPAVRYEDAALPMQTPDDTRQVLCNMLSALPLPQAEPALLGMEGAPGSRVLYFTSSLDEETLVCLSRLGQRCRLMVFFVTDADDPVLPDNVPFECVPLRFAYDADASIKEVAAP